MSSRGQILLSEWSNYPAPPPQAAKDAALASSSPWQGLQWWLLIMLTEVPAIIKQWDRTWMDRTRWSTCNPLMLHGVSACFSLSSIKGKVFIYMVRILYRLARLVLVLLLPFWKSIIIDCVYFILFYYMSNQSNHAKSLRWAHQGPCGVFTHKHHGLLETPTGSLLVLIWIPFFSPRSHNVQGVSLKCLPNGLAMQSTVKRFSLTSIRIDQLITKISRFQASGLYWFCDEASWTSL